jgi:hypothetical protein
MRRLRLGLRLRRLLGLLLGLLLLLLLLLALGQLLLVGPLIWRAASRAAPLGHRVLLRLLRSVLVCRALLGAGLLPGACARRGGGRCGYCRRSASASRPRASEAGQAAERGDARHHGSAEDSGEPQAARQQAWGRGM